MGIDPPWETALNGISKRNLKKKKAIAVRQVKTYIKFGEIRTLFLMLVKLQLKFVRGIYTGWLGNITANIYTIYCSSEFEISRRKNK